MVRPVFFVPRVAVAALVCVIFCLHSTARGTVFRWDDGEPIPGTEAITVGPGMIVDGLEIQFADLFEASLTAASFVGADVSDGFLDGSTLTDANFSGAVLTGASFQFVDATGANFTNADLQFAFLDTSTLVEADFSNADLRDASFVDTMVTDANFTGAMVNGTAFVGSNFGEEQLYTTASYDQKNLQGIAFFLHDLSGWDFSGQDLTGADLGATDLTGTNLAGAIIADSLLGSVTGLTEEQFASTASYQQNNLRGIDLSNNDFTGWDFSGQDLSRTGFERATLAGADFADAIVEGARFDSTVAEGFTKEQLYSTASYQQRQLQRIRLRNNNLDGWDFSGQDLRGANLTSASLVGTDFSLADLRGAQGFDPDQTTLVRNTIDPDSILINLELEPGETLVAGAGGFLGLPVAFFGQFSIDPAAKVDLTDNTAIVYQAPASDVRAQLLLGRGGTDLVGAWDGNGMTSSAAAAANETDPGSRSIGYARNGDLPLGPYDEFHAFPVDANSVLVAYTRTGDANLDGVVDDADVTVVSAEYAPGVPKPHWALGDFDYNGFVDDADVTLLGVFYDPAADPIPTPIGAANSVAAVPEPRTIALLLAGLLAILLRPAVRRNWG
jgi:uncharacterized protein YjbI with pentapeptide repeats